MKNLKKDSIYSVENLVDFDKIILDLGAKCALYEEKTTISFLVQAMLESLKSIKLNGLKLELKINNKIFYIDVNRNKITEKESLSKDNNFKNISVNTKLFGNILCFFKYDKKNDEIDFVKYLIKKFFLTFELSYFLISSEKKKTERIIEDMSEGVLLFKEGKKLILINDAGKKILGLPRKQEIDKAKKEFVEMIFQSLLKEFKDTSDYFEKEIKLTYPQEKIIKIMFSHTGEKNQDSLVVLRDITQFKEIERLKDEIISTVSHELRTPLTAIDAMISNMRRGITGELNEKQKAYLERVKANIDRLASLINNLLDISKLESGKITLIKDFYNIKEIIENVNHLLEQPISNKNIDFIKYITPKKGIIIYGDKERLEQVLINLVYNAVKFTHAGGKIMAKAYITSKRNLKVEVVDNGIGIEKGEIQKLFRKFSQLGRTYGAGEKGTGLGLVICKKIIEMHGGKIGVKSPPDIEGWDKGSQFFFEIPIKKENEILTEIIKEAISDPAKDNNIAVVRFKFDKKTKSSDISEVKKTLRENIKSDIDILFHFPNSKKIYIILKCEKKNISKILKRLKKIAGKKSVINHLIFKKDFYEPFEAVKHLKK